MNKETNKVSVKDIKKNKQSFIAIILLTLVVSVITYYRIIVQIEIGPVSDSVVYMANALYFAGQGIGYTNLLFPPFFPILVSIVYRLGYIATETVFIVDGLLFIFGVVGMFLLLKIRFNVLESFLGALLYATFPIVLIILGLGLSDLPSVSLTIWTFYFLILSVKKDCRFFYMAFPLAMLSFLTRYNNALLIFPIFLFIIINRDKIKYKHVIGGIATSVAILLPVLIFFKDLYGNFIYPFINFTATSTITTPTENFYYNPNVFYFIQNFPSFVGNQGIIILSIIALGCLVYFFHKIYKGLGTNNINWIMAMDRNSKLKILVLIVIVSLFVLSFGKVSFIISELIFFALALLLYNLIRSKKWKFSDVDLTIFTWFMVFFIFHSVFVIKDYRYFVLMAVPVSYLMILGLSLVMKKFDFKIKGRNIIFPVLTIILVGVMLLSTAYQIPHILQSNGEDMDFNQKIVETSLWLKNYDPNYINKNIYSDLYPNFSWFLKTNVKPMPVFKDNKIYTGYNFTLNQNDSKSFNNYLVSNNAYYYISVREGLNLTSYTPIKKFGYMIIYKRNF